MVKRIVEDLVRRMQDEVRSLEQFGVALDQGKCPGTDVILNRAGRMRPNVEGAIHNRPWTGGAGGIDRLDAKQGGDDGGRSLTRDRLRERLRHIVGPHRQTALQYGPGLSQVTGRRLHRLLDDASEARTEVDLLRKDLNGNMEGGHGVLHRRIAYKGDFVSAITQRKARGHQWR